jgi:hypothetical protein
MHIRSILIVALLFFAFGAAMPSQVAEAHRSGCHRWHSCPSDTGSYVCGDLGYDDYCPNKPKDPTPVPQPQPAAPPQTSAPPQGAAPASPAATRPIVDWRTYDTDALFMSYWQRNGGLPVFGLAKTVKYSESGHDAQIFERNRLEFHPENPAPYDVQLGLLGEERLLQIGRVWQNEPRAQPQPGCRYFTETGHNLCEPFLSYWRAHGLEFDGRKGSSEAESLALFGYPIAEAVSETGADGVARPTQWFQRARFEDHGPEGVLLGLLGNEVYGQ